MSIPLSSEAWAPFSGLIGFAWMFFGAGVMLGMEWTRGFINPEDPVSRIFGYALMVVAILGMAVNILRIVQRLLEAA